MSRINCPDGVVGALLGTTSPYTTDTNINYGTEDMVIFNPPSNLNSIINASSSANMKAGRTFIINNIGISTVTLKAYNSGGAAITLAVLNNGIAYVTILTTNPQVAADFQIVVGSNGIISKNNDYTILNNDGVSTVLVTVVNKTVTLPSAASNNGRIITVKKNVSGNGITTIKGASAGETIDGVDGTVGIALDFYQEFITVQSTGSVWEIINWYMPEITYSLSLTGSIANWVTIRASGVINKSRTGEWFIYFSLVGGSDMGTAITITIANVVFKNVSLYNQGLAGASDAATWTKAVTIINTGNIDVLTGSNANYWRISGKVELNAKPNFVV